VAWKLGQPGPNYAISIGWIAAWKVLLVPSEDPVRAIAIIVALLAGGVATADGINVAVVASACDSSPGHLDAQTRKHHGEIARRAVTTSLHDSHAEIARPTQLDVSVIGWTVSTVGSRTDVTAEVRIVICDGHGKMLSIVHGKATVTAHHARVADLREQAISEAVGGLSPQLRSQLQSRPNA
jgi:hypothetical protein